jgi:signal transduction histidine kinase
MPWNSQASARSARISTALAYLSAILAATALGGWALAVPTLYRGEEMTVVLLVVVPCLILSGAVGALSFRLTKSVREIASERVAKEVLEAELELRERSEDELRQANRAKDEFLGVLSHELRSPLNVIIGYSQILEGLDPASDAHSRAVDAIRRNALAEARLVEDTLELSRIVSGKLVLKRAAFHLGETIREVVDAVRVTIDGKDLQLLAEIDAAVGACDGDEGRIRQVLSNILSNAVKFNTENGQIRLSARRVGRDYEIAVEDTGIGLERDSSGAFSTTSGRRIRGGHAASRASASASLSSGISSTRTAERSPPTAQAGIAARRS